MLPAYVSYRMGHDRLHSSIIMYQVEGKGKQEL